MTIEDIKDIQIHFVVSTARTGSTLLSSMFNMHENLLSPVEEPFAYNLYFKYNSITNWTSKIIDEYCYDFYLFSEGVLENQFGTPEELKQLLEKHKEHLDYEIAVKITYLCFFPERDKSKIKIVIDKQLRFHEFIEQVAIFFPKSKFILLTRDPRDNALVKMKRIKREGSDKNKFDRKNNYYHLALDWSREYALLYNKLNLIESNRYIHLRYEDLVENSEKELLRIASFLDFKYKPQMLQYHEVVKESMEKNVDLKNEAKKHFFELHKSLTEKVNTEKVGFWKKELDKNDANVIWSICCKQAIIMGYEAQGCSSDVHKGIAYYNAFMKYCFMKVLYPKIYYSMPFFMRYWAKKIKYRKSFKRDRYASSN
jgi:hypothetical protein